MGVQNKFISRIFTCPPTFIIVVPPFGNGREDQHTNFSAISQTMGRGKEERERQGERIGKTNKKFRPSHRRK